MFEVQVIVSQVLMQFGSTFTTEMSFKNTLGQRKTQSVSTCLKAHSQVRDKFWQMKAL